MDGVWEDMRIAYQKMGLSDEEIAKRLICKTTKAINRESGLGACDKKGGEKNEQK